MGQVFKPGRMEETEKKLYQESIGRIIKRIVEMFEEEGYEPLNINKTGGLGGSTLMWDFNKCAEEALKYKTRTTFFKGSSGAYDAAWSNGWLDEICSHMTLQQNPKGYWTKERCRDEAGNYPTRTAFQQGSVSASNASWKNGWLDEFFPK